MHRRQCCAAIAAILTAPAALAAGHASLTIYHANDDALFSSSAKNTVDAGHALVGEQRQINLAVGSHDIKIDGLPANVDPESMAVAFKPDAGVSVLQQQLRVERPLADALGKTVEIVPTGTGSRLRGTLIGWGYDDAPMIRSDDGTVTLVRNYASMTLPGGAIMDSSTLRLRVDAKSAGQRDARLAYMTSGLGWRAAYTATLADGAACRMQFKAEASIANRSGRDYDDAAIKLVAGQVNLGGGIRFRTLSAPAPMAAGAAMPEQAALGDYRSYTLPGTVSLPNGSVTLTPLYAPQTLACTRQYLVEDGNSYSPPRPRTNDFAGDEYTARAITSTLAFTAPAALPSGTLHAWLVDHDGAPALLGEGTLNDTPKGQQVSVQLGQSFDLRASRTRTAFHLDAAAHTLDESYAITLSNGGDAARTVTLREHPTRWHAWTLTQSSVKPTQQTPQLLEFDVGVPGNGKVTLTYSVRYTWAAQDL